MLADGAECDAAVAAPASTAPHEEPSTPTPTEGRRYALLSLEALSSDDDDVACRALQVLGGIDCMEHAPRLLALVRDHGQVARLCELALNPSPMVSLGALRVLASALDDRIDPQACSCAQHP